MSLSAKVTLIMALTLALLVAFSHTVLLSVVRPSFAELEVEEALDNFNRVERSIRRELQFIRQITEDYSSSTLTYNFAIDQNDEYRRHNLVPATFVRLGINAILLFNTEAELIWGDSYDLESGEPLGLDIFDAQDFTPGSRLVNHKDEQNPVDGMLMTDYGPILIASLPILRNEGRGSVKGTLMMGRFLAKRSGKEFDEQSKVHFSADRFETAIEFLPARVVRQLAGVNDEPVHHEYDSVISTHLLVRDINDSELIVLRVDTPRDISRIGSQTIWITALLIGLSGSVALLVMSLFLGRFVLYPVSRLTQQVVSVSEGGSLKEKFEVNANDEIGILSREFNSMVKKLRSIRLELLEQSYKAGMAETASGTLHNIRNALSPVVSRATQIRTKIECSPTKNLTKAIVETSNPAIPDERRNKLQRYAELASKGLLDRDNQIADNLDDMLKQVSEIEKILNWQNAFARADLVIESVDLGDVIRTAHSLIPKRMSERIDFVFDGSLRNVKAVRAQRISLIQVIQNILITRPKHARAGTREA